VVITEVVDAAPVVASPAAVPAARARPSRVVPEAAPVKRSSRLASKEPQLYEPIEVRAVKLRGLKDALGGCTEALQRQLQKHGALGAVTKPLRKRAVDAFAAAICSSSVPSGADD
jgi:hypothetical protein